MKTKLILLGILFLCGWFFTFKWGQMHKEESERKGSNIEALRQDTTTKAAVLKLTQKELKKSFPAIDSIAKAYEKQERARVLEIRSLHYTINSLARGRTDTFWKELPNDSQPWLPPVLVPIQTYNFTHGCLSTVVTIDSSGPVEVLTGKIEQTTYVGRYDPKWWEYITKWRYWNKDNRPVTIETRNNCDLNIEQNIIFEIK